ncbi:MAG: molybdopterin-synthase adenylyltransferase MoeB [Pontibacter sp.]|nr:molybdopterin-synthase adenylyltransferase MoeB [Pontibacter sp.]
MLLPKEIKRYSRHLMLPEIGLKGQERLKGAKVLMIGAGGLGCPVLQYLTAAGVGTIGIVDDDVVDESNLQRQILYWQEDVGRKKAVVAAEKLAKQNPFVQFHTYAERLTTDNANVLFKEYDVIIDGSDNFPTRYLVNDVCMALDKPLVFGSILRFEGQVSVFNFQNGPTYRCIYPAGPEPGEMPNCSEVGVLGVLPGLIGSYMANEAIKIICQVGEVLAGKLLVVNTLENSSSLFSFERTDTSSQAFPVPSVACTSTASTIQEVTYQELSVWLEETEDVYLVDVREPYEFESFNIGGENIPLSTLQDQMQALPVDKKIVFCCQSGLRSMFAASLFVANSINRSIFNLKGGLQAAKEVL